MLFNRKNRKNKNHKKANQTPLFKIEPLEERLMLSATAVEWQTEIESINYAEHVVSNFANNSTTIDGVYAANQETSLYQLAKLSDLIDESSQNSIQTDITTAISTLKDKLKAAVDTISSRPGAESDISARAIYTELLESNNIVVTNLQGDRIAEITLINDENGENEAGGELVLTVTLAQEIAKTENQSLIASLYDLPENSLNLHVNLEHLNSLIAYNLAIKLDGKDSAEIASEDINAVAQFRQITAANDSNAMYGALALNSVADAENDNEIPDLKLGLSQNLASTDGEIKQKQWADLNFAVVNNGVVFAEQGRLANDQTLTINEFGKWKWQNQPLIANFENTYMGDILSKLSEISRWLQANSASTNAGESRLLSEDFYGLITQNAAEFAHLTDGINTIIKQSPRNLQELYLVFKEMMLVDNNQNSTSFNLGKYIIHTDADTGEYKLKIPFEFTIMGKGNVNLSPKIFAFEMDDFEIKSSNPLTVTANSTLKFNLILPLKANEKAINPDAGDENQPNGDQANNSIYSQTKLSDIATTNENVGWDSILGTHTIMAGGAVAYGQGLAVKVAA